MKKRSWTIIFNKIPNSLNKGEIFKNMVNIFNVLTTKMTYIWNFHPSSRDNFTSREGIFDNQPKEKLSFWEEF